MTTSPVPTGSRAPAALRVDGLGKRYGTTIALRDMTFDIAPGEIFGFVGSNGAGKSTTMRIILGVLAADTGRVLLGDSPVDLAVRRQIGYMPEERGLYPKMKVGAQLRYLAQLHGMNASDAHDRAAHWVARLGVADRIDDAVGDLSLGNQQRVQLAAALVADPAVLVLDEPFSGLDPVAVDVMSDVLKEKASEGVPVMFSSHQLELVQRLCDRVGIIARGEMRAIGTVDDLRARGNVRLEVSGTQPPGWADGLPGVVATAYRPGTTHLTLDDAADDQHLLRVALAEGAVHTFSPSRPDLTELFREVVAA